MLTAHEQADRHLCVAIVAYMLAHLIPHGEVLMPIAHYVMYCAVRWEAVA